MNNYKILNVQYGETEGGIACGPVGGNAIVTVKYNDGDEDQFLSLVDVMGIPNFYLSDVDIFDKMIEDNCDDEDYIQFMNEHWITKFEDVECLDEYYDIFEYFYEKELSNAAKLIKFIISIIGTYEDREKYIEQSINKNIDEIDISETNWDEEYIEY